MVLTSYPNIDRHFVETTEAMIPRTASIVKVEKKKTKKKSSLWCFMLHADDITVAQFSPMRNFRGIIIVQQVGRENFSNLHIES